MVMAITKFHYIIQHKITWIIILGIIIFSFVIWGTVIPSGQAGGGGAAGMLDGQPVTQDEFRASYNNTFLGVCLLAGGPPKGGDQMEARLRQNAWKRLASLRVAKGLGLAVEREEVAKAIQELPYFNDNGRFNRALYDNFTQRFLAQLGYSREQFEEYIRQQVLFTKLRGLVAQAALVPPREILRAYHTLNDKFLVEYVVLGEGLVRAQTAMDDQQARAYYAAQTNEFREPERVRVRYVAFPVGVTTNDRAVSEEDLLAYYDEHQDLFMPPGAAARNAGDTNAPANTVTNLPLPYEQVRERVRGIMSRETAMQRAAELATDFAVSLAPDRAGHSLDFSAAAQKAALPVQTTAPFALYEKVPGIDAAQPFNNECFQLNPAADENFTDAIPGSNAVYVAALVERVAPHVPPYEKIGAQVRARALAAAVRAALQKRADAFHGQAAAALAAGKSFETVAAAAGLKARKTREFSLTTGLEAEPYADLFLPAVIACNQGELTKPLKSGSANEYIVACAVQRSPAAAAGLGSARVEIQQFLQTELMRELFDDWQNGLLTKAGFKDLQAAPAAEAPADETDRTPTAEE